MANVIATGAAPKRRNPFSQLLTAGGAVARGVTAGKERNAFEEATQQFTTDVESGISPQKALLRVAQSHPTAVSQLTESGIVAAGQGASDLDAAAESTSVTRKLLESLAGQGKKSMFDKETGELKGNDTDDNTVSLIDVVSGLTDKEFQAAQRNPSFKKLFTENIAKQLDSSPDEIDKLLFGEVIAKRKEERAEKRTLSSEERAEKRTLSAEERAEKRTIAGEQRKMKAEIDSDARKDTSAIKLAKFKAKLKGPQRMAFDNKIVQFNADGSSEIVVQGDPKTKFHKADVGLDKNGIAQSQLFAEVGGVLTPAMDQDGNLIKGPKSSISGATTVTVDENGVTTFSTGGTGTRATQSRREKELDRVKNGLISLDNLTRRINDGGNVSFGVTGNILDIANVVSGEVFNELPFRERNLLIQQIKTSTNALIRSVSADSRFSDKDRVALKELFPKEGWFTNEKEATDAVSSLQAMFLQRLFIADGENADPDRVETMSPSKARTLGITPRSLVKLGRDGFLTREQSALFIKNFFPDAFKKAAQRTSKKGNK